MLLAPPTLLLAACGAPDGTRQDGKAAPAAAPELAPGEQRTKVAPPGEPEALLRSGADVPVTLPRGISLYPGARVVSNTMVERTGPRGALLVFETRDGLAEVMIFYRAQAQAAGLEVTLDIGGESRASLGGRLPSGGTLALSARREGGLTRAELAWE